MNTALNAKSQSDSVADPMTKAAQLLKDIQVSKQKFKDETGKTVVATRADEAKLADAKAKILQDLKAADEDVSAKLDEALLTYVEDLEADDEDFDGLGK